MGYLLLMPFILYLIPLWIVLIYLSGAMHGTLVPSRHNNMMLKLLVQISRSLVVIWAGDLWYVVFISNTCLSLCLTYMCSILTAQGFLL